MKKTITILLSFVLTLLLIACEGENNNANNLQNKGETSISENNSKVLPIEVKEFGYSMSNEYVVCSVILHNPNEETAIELPSFRITARNEAGELLATEDQTLSIIYPQQDFVYASQMFDVDEVPANVEIEILEPEDYNIKNISMLDHPEYTPLDVVSATFRTDSIVGEIQNNNDYDLDGAIVSVVFRDDNGKLIGGALTFVDSLKANSATPFDMSIYQKFATDNFEVYANIWW